MLVSLQNQECNVPTAADDRFQKIFSSFVSTIPSSNSAVTYGKTFQRLVTLKLFKNLNELSINGTCRKLLTGSPRIWQIQIQGTHRPPLQQAPSSLAGDYTTPLRVDIWLHQPYLSPFIWRSGLTGWAIFFNPLPWRWTHPSCSVTKLPIIKVALEKLVDAGQLVRENEPTPWISNLLVHECLASTTKAAKVLICLDPLQIINDAIIRPVRPIHILEENIHYFHQAKIFSIYDVKDAFYTIKLTESSSRRRQCTHLVTAGPEWP